jgi:hypothetical protein
MTHYRAVLLLMDETVVSVREPHIQYTCLSHFVFLRLDSAKTLHITFFLASALSPNCQSYGSTPGCQPAAAIKTVYNYLGVLPSSEH